MNLFKNFFKNNSTVVGLCDLKRRTAVNSFNFNQQFYLSKPAFELQQPAFAGQRLY